MSRVGLLQRRMSDDSTVTARSRGRYAGAQRRSNALADCSSQQQGVL